MPASCHKKTVPDSVGGNAKVKYVGRLFHIRHSPL